MKISDPPLHGIHTWLMTAARQCALQGVGSHECVSILEAMEGRLRRKYQTNEVRNAVEKVYSTTLPERPEDKKWRERREPAPKPKQNTAKTAWDRGRTNILAIKLGYEPVDLWEASPVRIDGGFSQDYALRSLFPDPRGLVCVGKSMAEFYTARLDQFKDLTKCALIVPAYMTARYGRTQNGKRSMHAKDNTGQRRFCVCDFDEPSSEHHASIIWHMRNFWDLAMVLSSGGKSLHAWFRVEADDEREFWRMAGGLGADLAIQRNHSQFVRLPMGTRDNGNPQSVYYFDEEVAKR